MRHKYNIFLVLVFIGFLCLFTTCKNQGANPCAGGKEPTADFTMMETSAYPSDETYDTDTTLGGGEVAFNALEQGAKYEWKIGTDTFVHTQKSFNLDFSSYYGIYYPNVPPVSVMLKVTKPPTSCFPVSDSVHYMTRMLYFVNNTLMRGTFRGRFSFDTSLKTIAIIADTIIGNIQGAMLIGLPGENHKIYTDSILTGLVGSYDYSYRQAVFNFGIIGIQDNYLHLGKMMVRPDNKSIFVWIQPYYEQSFTFTGTRIH